MKINLYTTCVNYADFFAETLKFNHKLFEKIYVATSTQDVETHKLGEKYQNLHIEKTDSFFDNGAKFNKGKGLNTVLKYIEPDTWNIIGDADCIYNENLINEISAISQNDDMKDNLFGCYRLYAENKQRLDSVLKDLEVNPYLEEISKDPFKNPEFNPDFKNPDFNPDFKNSNSLLIGFCQIFNSSSKFLKNSIRYEETHPTAATSDVHFKHLWPKECTFLLHSKIIHLGYTSKNWDGRVTSHWDADLSTDCQKNTTSST